MYLIGLDNGGTSTKAAVFDVNGNEVATAGRHTKLITPKPGYTERDMEELWLANCACVREALEKAGIDGKDVLGIAVCGHGKGMYAWGKDNKPAYNGIISTDNRAWQYTKSGMRTAPIRRCTPSCARSSWPASRPLCWPGSRTTCPRSITTFSTSSP